MRTNTGGVLPVLAHDGWTIEPIWLDRGTGLAEWIEIRHGDTIEHLKARADLLQLLQRHGLRYADFRETDAEDGCE